MSNDDPRHDGDLDRQLDRLVDGELSHDEYRQVMARLEAAPDGWRRCAWAFLESQSWREAMRRIPRASTAEGEARPALPKVPGSARPKPRGLGASAWFSLAGVIVLSFAAGRFWGDGSASSLVSKDAERMTATADASHTVEPPIVANEQWRFVRDGYWNGRSALPISVRQALEESGARVRERRGYVPVVTIDGQHVVLPYEEVQVIPARISSY